MHNPGLQFTVCKGRDEFSENLSRLNQFMDSKLRFPMIRGCSLALSQESGRPPTSCPFKESIAKVELFLQ